MKLLFPFKKELTRLRSPEPRLRRPRARAGWVWGLRWVPQTLQPPQPRPCPPGSPAGTAAQGDSDRVSSGLTWKEKQGAVALNAANPQKRDQKAGASYSDDLASKGNPAWGLTPCGSGSSCRGSDTASLSELVLVSYSPWRRATPTPAATPSEGPPSHLSDELPFLEEKNLNLLLGLRSALTTMSISDIARIKESERICMLFLCLERKTPHLRVCNYSHLLFGEYSAFLVCIDLPLTYYKLFTFQSMTHTHL